MTTADRKSPPHRIAELHSDLERLQGKLTGRERDAKRLQRKNDRLQRENERLKQQVERLKRQLDEARRAGRRQAAPFAKDRPQGRGGRPGRRAGAEYGRHGCRPRPARVDETHAAAVPVACPDCGGAVEVTRVASQYQEELPVVRPVVRRFDIEVGHCSRCQRRVQGHHVLQTSDALGAAGVQLGPGVVALVVELHTEMGVPLAKVAHLLRTTFGLQVTPGGLAHVLHRAARAAAPAYAALCVQPASVSHATSSSRPDVVVANSRCSVVTVRPAATRTHAFTRREWTSNPAHRRYRTSILHLLIARRWRGVRRNEIYKTRSPGEPVSQYGVLAGLRVQLYDGLSAPRTNRPLCQRRALHTTPVSCMRGSGSAGW